MAYSQILSSMVAAYATGIYLITAETQDHISNLLYAHFVISVSISGSFSPKMYIHLLEARNDHAFSPSLDLSSLRFASFTESDVGNNDGYGNNKDLSS